MRQKNKHLPKIAEWVKANAPGDPIIPLSVAFEERLAPLAAPEADEECKKLGTKSALPKIITTMRQSLHLNSFFTTGADEVRQWTIREGTKAPQAAGVIHGGMFRPLGGPCYDGAMIELTAVRRQISRRRSSRSSSTTMTF